MRKSIKLTACLALASSYGLISCSGSGETMVTPVISPTPVASVSTGPSVLTIEQVVLAKPGQNDKLEPVADGIFARGSKVHMVLVNVSGFHKGPDGKNQIDIDMQVKDPTGKVIYTQQGLLGAAGRSNLPNNIASSPYGAFETSTRLTPGNYMITLTIHDLIGLGRATESRRVILK